MRRLGILLVTCEDDVVATNAYVLLVGSLCPNCEVRLIHSHVVHSVVHTYHVRTIPKTPQHLMSQPAGVLFVLRINIRYVNTMLLVLD